MQPEFEPSRSQQRKSLISIDRPDSSKLVDLHVYIIPKTTWKNRQNLAENEVMKQAISAGFVHVLESINLFELRQYITNVCGREDSFPMEFMYLRSVGRCLTKVKRQQEKELKVKHYRPPMAFAPEIYIIESNHDDAASISKQPISSFLQPSNTLNSTNGIKSTNTILSSSSSNSYSTRDSKYKAHLEKLRQEQERLHLLQNDLSHKRHQLEDEYKKHQAAAKIQNAFRQYRQRRILLDEKQKAAAIEFEHLERARLACRKQKEIAKLSKRIEEVRRKCFELESNRLILAARLKQLRHELYVRRHEERELWRQKYFMEKNKTKTSQLDDKVQEDDSSKMQIQLEQLTNRLNEATKLRQQAEYESHFIRGELQQICSTLNMLRRYRLPKECHHLDNEEPISFHIELEY